MKQVPIEIVDVLQDAATKYSESTYTTNAGKILRVIDKVIPVSLIVKLFTHKLNRA